jgi:hypothetical protein
LKHAPSATYTVWAAECFESSHSGISHARARYKTSILHFNNEKDKAMNSAQIIAPYTRDAGAEPHITTLIVAFVCHAIGIIKFVRRTK